MLLRLSEIRPNTLLGRFVRLPLAVLPSRLVVRVLSGVNKGYRWRVGSSIHGCWIGSYEADKQLLVQRLVRPGMTAYDVGANAGFYTLALSRLVRSGRVYAFEPFAENCVNLYNHIRMNALSNIELFQVAVANQSSISGFHVSESNAMGYVVQEAAYHVATVSLDDLIEKYGLPIPDVVKMDIEGGEFAALNGGRHVLERKTTIFIIALHGKDQRHRCGGILANYGYSVFRLDGAQLDSQHIDVDEIYALPPRGNRR